MGLKKHITPKARGRQPPALLRTGDIEAMKDANKTTLRLTALLICLLVVTGCSDGEIVETEATVIKVIPTDGLKGCWGGPNFSTTLKMDDGHVDTICAYVGEPGEKIKGYWGSGHWDGTKNGFKLRD